MIKKGFWVPKTNFVQIGQTFVKFEETDCQNAQKRVSSPPKKIRSNRPKIRHIRKVGNFEQKTLSKGLEKWFMSQIIYLKR